MFTTVSRENHVYVKYIVETSGSDDVEKIAVSIARECSIGHENFSQHEDFSAYAAKVVGTKNIDSNLAEIEIAFPLEIFEFDNLPQLLSVISSNAFGIHSIKRLFVKDVELPDSFIDANRGPVFGRTGIKDKLRVHDRPLISTVIKPKVGSSPKAHAKLAYQAFIGGVDIVRDDENLADTDRNPFYERISLTLEALRAAEKVTGEKKMYVPNLTARISEMYGRAKFVEEMGGTAGMIDLEVVGISGVQFMRDQNLDLVLYGHRMMRGSDLKEDQGISSLVMARIMRLAGIDALHIPAIKSSKNSIYELLNFLKETWGSKEKMMPAVSGALHVGHIQKLIEIDGDDQIINVGSGIFSHPDGVEAGARAVRTAIEGVVGGQSLKTISRDSTEVKRAIDKWGVYGEDDYKDSNEHTSLYPLVKTGGTAIVVKDDMHKAIAIKSRDTL